MPSIIDRAKGANGLFDLRKEQFNAEVRPVVTTTTYEYGEEVTTEELGDPLPCWIDFRSGAERIEGGGLEQDQSGVVQLDYAAAREAGIGADDTLEHRGERLYCHSTKDLHQAGEILEVTVTRTSEEVQA